jgi:hypothetical protein
MDHWVEIGVDFASGRRCVVIVEVVLPATIPIVGMTDMSIEDILPRKVSEKLEVKLLPLIGVAQVALG